MKIEITTDKNNKDWLGVILKDENSENIGYVNLYRNSEGHHLPDIRVEILGKVLYDTTENKSLCECNTCIVKGSI